MKKIKLLKLSLKNFKGIKDITIEPKGKNMSILGDNGTGKTTIYDAFMWVLFGKDSSYSTNFGIKTYDKDGNTIHGLDHEVEALISAEGKEITLKRVYKEKWTKKRGEAERTLTGHTTDYFIDEVPKKASEYSEFIEKLLDEEVFKLITSVTYFNHQMHWTDRRDLLMDIVGYLTDEEIIDEDKELKPLLEVLDKRTLEDHKKYIKAQKKKYNKQIEYIPTRIDEINRGLPELADNIDYKKLEKEKKDLSIKIDEIDERINSQQAIGDKYKQKNKELNKLKTQLFELKLELENDKKSKLRELEYELERIEEREIKLNSAIEEKKLDLKDKNDIPELEKIIKELKSKYFEVQKTRFEKPSEDNFICPTCKQSLPETDKEQKLKEMQENFQKDKENTLAGINKKGKMLASRKKTLKEIMESTEEDISRMEDKKEELGERIGQFNRDIELEKEKLKDFKPENDEKYKELQSEIKSLEEEIEELDNGSGAKEEIEVKKSYQKQIEEINYKLNSKETIEKQKKRIKELKNEEESYRDKLMELEKDEYLLERFTIKKVDMLEDEINKKFDLVKFKLFDRKVNGAIEDSCEVTVDGVPYSDLNTAKTINAGLDVINVLVDKYQVSAPVFLDNKESVNQLIDTDSQIISLVVTKYKKLKTEVMN
jgi:DNA repair exonuclease SbcCD ATPase subunit